MLLIFLIHTRKFIKTTVKSYICSRLHNIWLNFWHMGLFGKLETRLLFLILFLEVSFSCSDPWSKKFWSKNLYSELMTSYFIHQLTNCNIFWYMTYSTKEHLTSYFLFCVIFAKQKWNWVGGWAMYLSGLTSHKLRMHQSTCDLSTCTRINLFFL